MKEKDKLSIRTDINLPKEILEYINEQGQKIGEDHRLNIDLYLGENQV